MFFVIISRECVAGLHDDDHDDDNHGGGVQFRFVLFCHVLFSLVFWGIKTDLKKNHPTYSQNRFLMCLENDSENMSELFFLKSGFCEKCCFGSC